MRPHLAASSVLVILTLALGCGSGEPASGGGTSTGGTSTGGTGGTTTTGTSTGGTATGGAGGTSTGTCGAAGETCCKGFACDPGLACDGAHCATSVAPYTCAPGAPEAVFVGEVPPPDVLAPWQRPFAGVTFANCGTETWLATAAGAPTGVKVGTASPHDATTWTPSRIALPADVPPGNQVTVVLPVQAPPLTGAHAYRFELVREGVAWLGQPSQARSITVATAGADPVTVCPGTVADRGGEADATTALQHCLDTTPPGGTLALPAGIYRVSGVLTVDQPLTLTTEGAAGAAASCLDPDAPPCAVLRAAPDTLPSSAGARGFVRLGTSGTAVTGVTLDHVLVDGDRGARLGSAAAAQCAAGNNGDGINLGANCLGCTITGCGSARALCGTGLEWDGDGVTVTKSVFLGNGDHDTTNMWSDGLTIHKSDGAVVDHCRFIDNSDVGFISGGGVNAKYTGNVAMQLTQTIFAGLMLDNFNNGALGDFSGAVLQGNTVVCAMPCHFGIELGPHPWYPSPNIRGGSVTGNTVVGANIQINAQGAGTAAQPTVIAGNTLGPTPSSAPFLCGAVGGLSPLNVSAESVVDLQGGAATGGISVPCP